MKLRLDGTSEPDLITYGFALRAIGQDLTALMVTALEIRIEDGAYAARGNCLRQGEFERKYDRAELVRLDKLGKTRATGMMKTPDAASLAEALRTVGRVVDTKGGRLIRVCKDEHKITFEYEDQGALQRQEHHTLTTYQAQQEAVTRRKKNDIWDDSK